jgi:hypothetical protein
MSTQRAAIKWPGMPDRAGAQPATVDAATCPPALSDVLTVLEGAAGTSTAAGIDAVRATWPVGRDQAVAWIRATVFAYMHRTNAVAMRYRRRFRIADRRLSAPRRVPSTVILDAHGRPVETAPHAIDLYADRHFETTEPRR